MIDMKLLPSRKRAEGNDNKEKNKSEGDHAKTELKTFYQGGFKNSLQTLLSKLPKQIDPSKSVGVRLFLIFFIAIMFFVLAIGIISYQKAKITIENNAKQANLQTIAQTSQKLDIVLKKYEENLQQTFLDSEMQNAILDVSYSNISDYDRFTAINKMKSRLDAMTLTSNSVLGVYMLSPEKPKDDIVSGHINQAFLDNVRNESWFTEATTAAKTYWLNVPEGNGSGKSIFRLVRSIQSVNTSQRFILVADINLDVINDYLKEVNLGANSRVQVLGPDNVVVASTKDSDIAAVTEFDLDATSSEKVGNVITKDAEGSSVLGVFNTQLVTGWQILGTVATAELTKDARDILSVTYIAAIIVAIAATLIAVWIVRMIAHPLAKLRNLMEEGSNGNLNVRMETKSRDEIGQLTVSFNVMMEKIMELVKQTNHSAQDVLETATELTQASNKTAISAREIAIATEEIANGATSLANEAERGNDLTDNISHKMAQVVHSNKEMESAARQVEQSSLQGTAYLKGLLDKTNITAEMISALTAKVDSLKSSTSSVLKVLDVMQSITQQTNILSLNATIEAARAGAAGRGFMVVADEIRQLADQSKQSITMVGQITDNIQNEMNETVQALSEASPLFQEQMNSVKETNQIFISVQEQMAGFIDHLDVVTASIDELNDSQHVMSDAMSNVSAVAQQSSATSEEVASLSSEQQTVGEHLVELSDKLESVSNGLKESLSKFSV